ncbi:phosphatase PAP2 family protein [Kitasatospora sp. NPDC088346]|uniref:phosphatase PAP2 family protein n=1 Tax=Kitasatospora sp. NPDC088346 TaxID=3364073 RepID=UPI00382096B9
MTGQPGPAPDEPRNTARTVVLAAGIPLLLFAALTVLLAVHGWTPTAAERWLHSWSVGHRPSAAVTAAGLLTDLGTGVPPYLAAAAAGPLALRHSPAARNRLLTALGPVLALALGQALRNGLMRAFGRPRPPVADWVAASPSGHAYPSGHAFTAAVAAGLLGWAVLRAVRRPRAVPVLAVLGAAAVGVGLTRVYLGVHWPLDVVGGWLLAAAWLGLCLPLLARVAGPPGPPGPLRPARRTEAAGAGPVSGSG